MAAAVFAAMFRVDAPVRMSTPGQSISGAEGVGEAGCVTPGVALEKKLANRPLKDGEMSVTDGALRDITRYYTREAGVRGLDREIAKISRKVVKSILTRKKDNAHITVNSKSIDKYLGVRRYTYGIAEKQNQIEALGSAPGRL